MSLSTSKITELAPDQESLNAAHKLMKPGKWPCLSQNSHLVWGECQGSGANPYRTVFDQINIGYKCTCPSRKFPCKHVLALMWMHAEGPSAFSESEPPSWVSEWLGRRRNTDGNTAPKPENLSSKTKPKSLLAAQISEPESPNDAEQDPRKKAATEKRTQATQQSIAAGLEELQQWLQDQLRSGLSNVMNDPHSRCRMIAARLVDAKAQAMASRLDELPSRLKLVPSEWRLDWLIQELGRIVLLCKAWLAHPTDSELTRLVGSSETRESILALNDAVRVRSTWQVVGEQISTRRDGLVSQSTWLLNLGDGNRFALLQDYFPASLGKRSSAFATGETFNAELVYYPARYPLRAIIAERKPLATPNPMLSDTSVCPPSDPLGVYRSALELAPWTGELPILLPPGHLAQAGNQTWWQANDQTLALPITEEPNRTLLGLELQVTVGIWDGCLLNLLSGYSQWGAWSVGSMI